MHSSCTWSERGSGARLCATDLLLTCSTLLRECITLSLLFSLSLMSFSANTSPISRPCTLLCDAVSTQQCLALHWSKLSNHGEAWKGGPQHGQACKALSTYLLCTALGSNFKGSNCCPLFCLVFFIIRLCQCPLRWICLSALIFLHWQLP